MLGAEWTTDVRPVNTHLLVAAVHLVLVRRVSEYGVVGIQTHHQIKILVGEDAAGSVERYLDIPDRENIRRRAAVSLRLGEHGQAQQQSKNDEWPVTSIPP
jgi:hypothetical protein